MLQVGSEVYLSLFFFPAPLWVVGEIPAKEESWDRFGKREPSERNL